MKIKIYKNWMRVYEPCRKEWEKHGNLLRPLCTCGSLGFHKKEDLISFLAGHNIEAVEETYDTENVSEQLMLF